MDFEKLTPGLSIVFERKLPIYYVAATISKSSSTIVRSGYDIVTRLVPGHFSSKHRVFVQTLNINT
ncbi:MAG: hypothetical protein D8M57_12865 [Candidatus Scalindua sp. AMX11]|nr:MAG: hypothetical protein DWQ00_12385 [Candidatus Scalindua sp.]TDE64521.1 MAG: hypothetical protein D8M57_12865 [Candidatus Scalindua sp. AMX11]